MKELIFIIICIISGLILGNFIGGILSTKRQCKESPMRIIKYTGLSKVYKLGCYLGERVG